jgi:hypothetical protein
MDPGSAACYAAAAHVTSIPVLSLAQLPSATSSPRNMDLATLFVSGLLAAAHAFPLEQQAAQHATDPRVRPLVLWHGMGDSYNGTGMRKFAERVKDIHPGIFVHLVRLAEKDEDDRRAGYVRSSSPRVSASANVASRPPSSSAV